MKINIREWRTMNADARVAMILAHVTKAAKGWALIEK